MLRGLINLSTSSGYSAALARHQNVKARVVGRRISLMAVDDTRKGKLPQPPREDLSEPKSDAKTPRATRSKRSLAPATPAPAPPRRLSAMVQGQGVLVKEEVKEEDAKEPVVSAPKRTKRTKKEYMSHLDLNLQGVQDVTTCGTLTTIAPYSAHPEAAGSHGAHLCAAAAPRASAGLRLPQHDAPAGQTAHLHQPRLRQKDTGCPRT